MGKYADALLNSTQATPKRGGRYFDAVMNYADNVSRGYTPEPVAEPTPIQWTPKQEPVSEPGFVATARGPVERSPETTGFGTLVQSGMVDDPNTKIRIFAKARGIPVDRYRVFNGDIIYMGDDGKWYPETQKTLAGQAKRFIGETLPRVPGDIATAGAAASGSPWAVPLVAAGAAGIRKTIGGLVYGEPQTVTGNIANMGVEAAMGKAGEVGGRLYTAHKVARGAGKGGAIALAAARDVASGAITPADHARAQVVQTMARKYGVELAPHQLYDKQGMTDIWKYLRRHPQTSDAIRLFEDNLSESAQKAMEKAITAIGKEEDMYIIGKRLKETSEKIIEKAEGGRTAAVRPIYRDAFANAPDVDVAPVLQEIADLRRTAARGGSAEKALNKIWKMLAEEGEPPKPGPKVKPPAPPKPTPLFEETVETAGAGLRPTQGEGWTLGGLMRSEGGVNFVNMQGELKDMPAAVKAISKKGGIPYDVLERKAREQGFLQPDEDLLDILRSDPKALGRRGNKNVAEWQMSVKGKDIQQQIDNEYDISPYYEEPHPEELAKMGDEDLFSFFETKAAEGKPRGVGAIAKDINTAIGKKGSVSLYDELSSDQKYAVARLLRDKKSAVNYLKNINIGGAFMSAQRAAQLEKEIMRDPAKMFLGLDMEKRLDVLDNVKKEIDVMIDGSDGAFLHKDVKRRLMAVKDNLRDQMIAVSPEYEAALKKYGDLSPAVDRLYDNVIGRLSRLTSDKEIAGATNLLFSSQNITPKLVKEAKHHIYHRMQKKEIWNDAISGYVRNIYEGLKTTETGKIVNVPGKMHKALFGTTKQKEILQAAMEPAAYKNLEDLMIVFQRASIGTGGESWTAMAQEIGKRLGDKAGSSIYQLAVRTKETAAEWALGRWNDAVLHGRQDALMKSLVNPAAIKQIQKMKAVSSNTRLLHRELGAFIAIFAGQQIKAQVGRMGWENDDLTIPSHRPLSPQIGRLVRPGQLQPGIQ